VGEANMQFEKKANKSIL